jgi:hypothetical protein
MDGFHLVTFDVPHGPIVDIRRDIAKHLSVAL